MGNCRSAQNATRVATRDHWSEVGQVGTRVHKWSFFQKPVKQRSHAVQTNMSSSAFDEVKDLQQQITTVKRAVCSEAVFVSQTDSSSVSREIMRKRFQTPLSSTRLLKRSYSMVQVTDSFLGKVDSEEGSFEGSKEVEAPTHRNVTSTGNGVRPCGCLCTPSPHDERPIPIVKSGESARIGNQADSLPVRRVVATKPPRNPTGASINRRSATEIPLADSVSVTRPSPRTPQRRGYAGSGDPSIDSRQTQRPSSSGVVRQSSSGTQLRGQSPVRAQLGRTPPPPSSPGPAKVCSSAPAQKVIRPATSGRGSVSQSTAKSRDGNARTRPSQDLTPPRSRLEYTFYVKDDDAFRRPFVDRHVEAIVRACQCSLHLNEAGDGTPPTYHRGVRVFPVTISTTNMASLKRCLGRLDLQFPQFNVKAFFPK
ncbi:hypothetical protein SprV_0401478100 [Sparganum proliferum]